ncbi:hypothetical protein WA158_001187 [Blastocystis sp. Blastoise]
MKSLLFIYFICCAFAYKNFVTYDQVRGNPYSVTYDNRTFFINGTRTLILGGSVHYPRVTAIQQEILFKEMKQDGNNVVETYLFWNIHEPVKRQYTWEGLADLIGYIERAAKNDLFVMVRLGPYINAEWLNGGLPTWLMEDPKIRMRINNTAYMEEVKTWITLAYTKLEPYLCHHGGPILMLGIENEFFYHSPGSEEYRNFFTQLALSLDSSIPWVSHNSPVKLPIIDTDGIHVSDKFGWMENHGWGGHAMIDTPVFVDEDELWFTSWGQSNPEDQQSPVNTNRGVYDTMYTYLRYLARGGYQHIFYMYYGGNHYGPYAGGATTTAYANGAIYHSDMLPNEPLHTHMAHFQRLLPSIADILTECPPQIFIKELIETDTENQFVEVYTCSNRYGTIKFMDNYNDKPHEIIYESKSFYLSPKTAVITRNNGVIYNTTSVDQHVAYTRKYYPATAPLTWTKWKEDIYAEDEKQKVMDQETPNNHLPTLPGYFSEYAVYQSKFTFSSKSTLYTTNDTCTAEFHGDSGACFGIYIDDQFINEVCNKEHTVHKEIKYTIEKILITPGDHKIAILSEGLGLENSMDENLSQDMMFKGMRGDFKLCGMTIKNWHVKGGLQGEIKEIFSDSKQVEWSSITQEDEPLTCYKKGQQVLGPNKPLLLNVNRFGRGYAYINGHNLGRYWSIYANQGKYTQQYYNIPYDFINLEGENELILSNVYKSADVSQVEVQITSQY